MKKSLSVAELPESIQDLVRLAHSAREKAYSPYSGYKVGAALKTSQGKVFSGCNVENSSYGATNCAERVAIQSAVASEGKLEVTEMVVVTDATPAWPPCGLCRQVMAEFSTRGGEHLKIYAVNLHGEVLCYTLKEILPQAFTPDYLRGHTHS